MKDKKLSQLIIYNILPLERDNSFVTEISFQLVYQAFFHLLVIWEKPFSLLVCFTDEII